MKRLFVLTVAFLVVAARPVAARPVAARSVAAARVTPPSADEIVKEACAEAKATHKKVLLLFHASWCGWCHKLDTVMNSPECKGFFDRSFVIRYLVVFESAGKKDLENPGAKELYDKYAGGDDQGIPFYLIFDEDGKVIADSRIKADGVAPILKGANTGYPGSDEEIAYFSRLLKATTSLSADEVKIIAAKLKKVR